jgi:hypothetical protein
VDSRVRVVYIAGTSFSGSTLLTMLLNRLPEIATVGEAQGQNENFRSLDLQCSCGDLVATCEVWRRIGKKMGEGFDPLNLGTNFYDFPGPSLIRRLLNSYLGLPVLDQVRDSILRRVVPGNVSYRAVLERNISLMRATLENSDASMFMDSSKGFVRLARLTASDRLSVSAIHLVRHPVAFCNSAFRHEGRSARDAAKWWNRVLAQALYYERHHLGRLIRIRYEDLVAAPERECDKLAAFLKLDRSPGSRGNFRDVEHHIIGNSMRLSSRREVVADDTWRTEMTAADIRIVNDLTVWGRQRLGYDETGASSACAATI